MPNTENLQVYIILHRLSATASHLILLLYHLRFYFVSMHRFFISDVLNPETLTDKLM